MLQFIASLLKSKSKPKIKIAHSILGQLQLEQGAKGPYWLREAYQVGELTLSLETVGETPPSDAQAKFFQWVNNDLEEIYKASASNLESRHQGMQRKPVHVDWHRTFRLVGISVPLEGNRLLPWDITFECLTDNSCYLYTCHFENGSLTHVAVDT